MKASSWQLDLQVDRKIPNMTPQVSLVSPVSSSPDGSPSGGTEQ